MTPEDFDELIKQLGVLEEVQAQLLNLQALVETLGKRVTAMEARTRTPGLGEDRCTRCGETFWGGDLSGGKCFSCRRVVWTSLHDHRTC